MSPIHDAFGNSVSPQDPANGKKPQNGEERLAAFRKEIDVEIRKFERKGKGFPFTDYDNHIRALNAAKEAADETNIRGNAEAAIERAFPSEFGLVPAGKQETIKAMNRAADRATSGTVFVQTPKKAPQTYETRALQAREEPKEPNTRERFYEEFRTRISNKASQIGGSDKVSNQDLTKSRALRFATRFPDGDPTLDRIGTRILAWHKGQIEGEETNELDGNAAKSLFQIAKQALEIAEESTGHSANEHVDQATPLIIEYISGKTTGGRLAGKERALQYVPHRYAGAAQKLTVLDFLKNSHMTTGLSKADLADVEQIAKDAVAHAHEQIDAIEASAKAEFEASVTDTEVPFEVHDIGEQPESSQPAGTNEPFKELIAAKAEELSHTLSEPQKRLLSAIRVHGCYDREDIHDIADEHYGTGKIDIREAQEIVTIATEIWAQTHGLENEAAPNAAEQSAEDTPYTRLLQEKINNAGKLGLWPEQVEALKVIKLASPETVDDIRSALLEHHEAGYISENRANTVLRVANEAWLEIHDPSALNFRQRIEENTSFRDLIEGLIQDSEGLSSAQISLLEALKENGCHNKFDVVKVANGLFSSGEIGIGYDEAWEVVSMAETAWDKSHPSGNGEDFTLE